MYDAQRWMQFLHTGMLQAGFSDYADLCRAMNIRQSNISRWQEGTQPGNGVIRKLSRELGVSVRDLLIAAGHFEPDDLPGDNDVLLTILDSGRLSDRQKVLLIKEWREYDAAHARLRVRICRLFSSQPDGEIADPDPDPPRPAREGTPK